MKLSHTLVVSLLLSGAAQSQVCLDRMSTWGGPANEWALLCGSTAGNRYVAGFTTSSGVGNEDLLLAAFGSDHSLLWARTFGGPASETAEGQAFDALTGMLYVCGGTTGFGANGTDVLVLQCSSSGIVQWARRYGLATQDHADGIAVDQASKEVFAAGGTGAGILDDALLLKIAQDGSLLWQRTLGGNNNDSFNAASVLDGSGAVVLAGNTESFGLGQVDALLVKVSSSGNLLWARTWGGARDDDAYSVAVHPLTGDIFMLGGTDSFSSSGNTDAFLTRWSASGDLLWDKTWGGSGFDSFDVIAFDGSNAVYLSGETDSFGAGAEDSILIALDGTLQVLWARTWGGASADFLGTGVVQGGHLITAGITDSHGGVLSPAPTGMLDVSGIVTTPAATLAMPSGTWQPVSGTVSTPASSCGGAQDVLLVDLDLGGGCGWSSYCFGEACPCGNDDPGAGCANSSGGGAFLTASGTTSVGADDLVLRVASMPPNVNGLVFRGPLQTLPLPFYDGLRCVGGKIVRMSAHKGGLCGSFSEGPGLASALGLSAGQSWSFQAWYRDPGGPCLMGSNLSNALRVDFVP